ncbi:MAG: four helix bundle protein [Candidatus Margulisiibacteriota bacterium]
MSIRETEYQKEKNRGAEGSENQKDKQRKIIPRHEKLWVWQKSHKLMIKIFVICKRLPREERYRLIDQVQRSSTSVPDNIAEGCSSYYFNSKIKSYFDSRKEAGETQNHIREMESKKYVDPKQSETMIEEYEEVIRGLNGLINKTCELRDMYKAKGIKRL